MKYIFLIACSIILPIFSLKEFRPNICINCKFFTNNIGSDNKYGKCLLFPKDTNGISFLVTGNKEADDHSYCSTARTHDDMCGKEGKMYKPLVKPAKNPRFVK